MIQTVIKPGTQFSTFSIICLFASSCANIVTPAGGPKDTQPPNAVSAIPENLSTRFKGDKITIEFNEYVKLDNPSQEIIISPAIIPEPKIHVRAKKLEIEFKDARPDSNTTYTINFGESLKDVNESNVLSNFQFVFSTGDILDSLSVSGKVVAAADDKPAAKALVMLHKDLADSALLKVRPYYFTKAADDGSFRFDHIGGGAYRLYALKDENFNYTYDLPDEEIAFMDAALVIDTNMTGIKLSLFREDREMPLKRIGMDDSKPGYLRLVYSGRVEELAATSFEGGNPVAVIEYNPARDTLLAWYIRAIAGDSIRLVVNKDSIEKITATNIPHDLDSLKKNFSELRFAAKDSMVGTEGFIAAVLNHPALSVASDRITVQQDSPRAEIKSAQIKPADGNARRVLLDFPRKPETGYTIAFLPGAATNYFGAVNDTLLWRVRTKSDEDYGMLTVSVSGEEGRSYILQMVDVNNGNKITEQTFVGSVKTEFKKILPGSYEIRIIYDANSNGKWDTGNYMQRRQPERVYSHPEKINVRANWEMEAELNLQ